MPGGYLREGDRAAVAVSVHAAQAEGTALNNFGVALVEVRRFEEAITAHQDAAAIYRETGDRHRESSALEDLATAQAARNA